MFTTACCKKVALFLDQNGMPGVTTSITQRQNDVGSTHRAAASDDDQMDEQPLGQGNRILNAELSDGEPFQHAHDRSQRYTSGGLQQFLLDQSKSPSTLIPEQCFTVHMSMATNAADLVGTRTKPGRILNPDHIEHPSQSAVTSSPNIPGNHPIVLVPHHQIINAHRSINTHECALALLDNLLDYVDAAGTHGRPVSSLPKFYAEYICTRCMVSLLLLVCLFPPFLCMPVAPSCLSTSLSQSA